MIIGKWFPGGTRVGVNQLVVRHDKGLSGENAYEHVLELWLTYSEEEAACMKRHFLNGWLCYQSLYWVSRFVHLPVQG